MLLLLLVISLLQLAICSNGQDETSYSVAIDAGSTGSRVFLYRISTKTDDASRRRSLSDHVDKAAHSSVYGRDYPWEFEMVNSIREDLPLSRFADAPEMAGESLQVLTDQVKGWLRDLGVDFGTVPIYLGATAGMRKVEKPRRGYIMKSVETFLKQTGFYFQPDYARILSGEEEGAFGWLASKYLAKLAPDDFPQQDFGALDLGGASTQITAEIRNILEGLFVLDTAPFQTDRVYSKSFLYFGVNEYFKQLLNYMIPFYERRTSLGRKVCDAMIEHPCLPKGENLEHVGEDGGLYCFNGTSDALACDYLNADFMESFLPPAVPCLQGAGRSESCSIQGSYVPSGLKEKPFVACSAFYYLWDFFEAGTGSEPSNVNKLMKNATKICSWDKDRLIAYAAKKDALPYYRNRCTTVYYVKYLLTKAYHFHPENTIIRPIDTIGGTTLNWALGLAIYENFRLRINHAFDEAKSASDLRLHGTKDSVEKLEREAILNTLGNNTSF